MLRAFGELGLEEEEEFGHDDEEPAPSRYVICNMVRAINISGIFYMIWYIL